MFVVCINVIWYIFLLFVIVDNYVCGYITTQVQLYDKLYKSNQKPNKTKPKVAYIESKLH